MQSRLTPCIASSTEPVAAVNLAVWPPVEIPGRVVRLEMFLPISTDWCHRHQRVRLRRDRRSSFCTTRIDRMWTTRPAILICSLSLCGLAAAPGDETTPGSLTSGATLRAHTKMAERRSRLVCRHPSRLELWRSSTLIKVRHLPSLWIRREGGFAWSCSLLPQHPLTRSRNTASPSRAGRSCCCPAWVSIWVEDSLWEPLVIEGIRTRRVSETYTQFPGKRSRVVSDGAEAVIAFRDRPPSRGVGSWLCGPTTTVPPCGIGSPLQDGWPRLAVAGERTGFRLPAGALGYACP